MNGSDDNIELAQRCAQLAFECSAPGLSEALMSSPFAEQRFGSAPGPPRVRRNWEVGVIDDSDHGLVTSSPRHQSAPRAPFCPSRLRALLRACWSGRGQRAADPVAIAQQRGRLGAYGKTLTKTRFMISTKPAFSEVACMVWFGVSNREAKPCAKRLSICAFPLLTRPRPTKSARCARSPWAAWHTGHCQAFRRVSDDGAERRPRLDNEKPRRRWGRGGAFNGRFAEEVESWTEPSVDTKMTRRREKWSVPSYRAW